MKPSGSGAVEDLLASLSPEARRALLAKLDASAPKSDAWKVSQNADTQIAMPGSAATSTSGTDTPLPRERGRRAPLSFGQRRLWFLHQLDPADTAYHIGYLIDWPGAADAKQLAAALNDLIDRHEILRTRFPAEDGEPWQQIEPPGSVAISLDASEPWTEDAARTPFDLEHGPLLRTWLVDADSDNPTLVLVVHHIIFDGWSMEVLLDELLALYQARTQTDQAPMPLAPLPAQYADFTRWQRQLLGRGVREEQAAYWRSRLGTNPEPLELPTDFPRGRAGTTHGATHRFLIPAQLRDQLGTVARRHETTIFAVVLAGFLAVLHRYTGRADIAVGTPVTNRDQPEFESLIGFFLNTVVLRADLSDEPAFGTLVDRVREAVLDAHDNRDLPFDAVVQELAPDRAAGSLPLTSVLFAYNAHVRRQTGAPHYREFDTGGSRAELTVLIEETADDAASESARTSDGLQGSLEYDASLYSPETAARMAGHLVRLLAGAAADPQASIADLPLLTDAELAELDAWNATDVASEAPWTSVPDLIARQATATPDATAVITDERTLTYRELWDRSSALDRQLRTLGTAPGTPVAVLLDRCADLVVSLVGIMHSGGAYLPLDPALPAERLEFVLADAGVTTVLTHRSSAERLTGPNLHVIALDELDDDTTEPATPHTIEPDDPAYVIYTSGSTGRPKGVVNTHRGLANHMLWMLDRYQPGPQDRILQKTPAGFDVSFWEFLLPLISGGVLVLTPPDGHRDADLLVELIERQQITMVHFVPSMLHAFLQVADPARFTSVRRVLCSGEALPADLVRRYYAAGFEAPIDNLYGPTEAAIHVTHWTCEPDAVTVPIGHPISNTRAYVVDGHGRQLPVGVPGELWLGGVQVADGYLGRPELTAERFTADPFRDEPAARVFRTGDLVRRAPDGSLDFLGRLDHQIKLRGYRIELGEIEAALLAHESVAEAVVLLDERAPTGPRLAAYVVPARTGASAGVEPAELSAHLERTLPAYMVPAVFTVLPTMPLSANGKIDRRAVAALAPANTTPTASSAEHVAPRDDVEATVAGLFAEILGCERVGVHDDFFSLGGHSLLATRLVAMVRRHFRVELALRELFEAPTVGGVAARVAARLSGNVNPAPDPTAAPAGASVALQEDTGV